METLEKKLEQGLGRFDLTSKAQRGMYLARLSLNTSRQLTELGIFKSTIRISDNQIEVGLAKEGDDNIYQSEFGTDITFSHKTDCSMRGKVESEINHGSTGSYNLSNKNSVWRSRAVVSILDNWNIMERIAIQATSLRNKLYSITPTKD